MSTSKNSNNVNHRTTVGIQRRNNTRKRLIKAAIFVIAEKGVTSSLVEDVFKAANMSRGTFYNYFQTTEEMLTEIGKDIADEMLDLIEPLVQDYNSPAKSMCLGFRLFLHTARAHPLIAKFMWRLGFTSADVSQNVHKYLPAHIERGIEEGVFDVPDAQTGIEITTGIAISAVFNMSNSVKPDNYPELISKHIVMALGVPAEEASKLCKEVLPKIELPDNSLLKFTNEIKEP